MSAPSVLPPAARRTGKPTPPEVKLSRPEESPFSTSCATARSSAGHSSRL
ncbi:hypothetical protein [Streptomyces daghestanicus]